MLQMRVNVMYFCKMTSPSDKGKEKEGEEEFDKVHHLQLCYSVH